MTLETLYLIMQIVAATAIVASLIFVGLQVHAQTREQKIQRINERANMAARINSWAIENPEMRAALAKASDGLATLSDDEFSIYSAAMRHVLLIHQLTQTAYAATEGAPGHKSAISIATRFLLTPGFEEWWAHFRDDYAEEFATYIDGLIAWGQSGAVKVFPGRERTFTAWGTSDDA